MINYIKNRIFQIQRIKTLEDKTNTLEEKIKILEGIIKNQQKRIIENLKPGTILNFQINNIKMVVPVELLQTYLHCLQINDDGEFIYEIESQCSNWMISHLEEGDVVLDIGAAFGVVSIPLAEKVGKNGSIYAFEPAKRTQQFLEQILDLNNYDNISIVKMAVSDRGGTSEFIEYSANNSFSWASDTSTLQAPTINPIHNHETYTVEITTIDDFVKQQKIQPKSIKIDIEGFELYALQGAKFTLQNYKPYLCIDIHQDVKTGKSALEGVEPFLKDLEYNLKMKAHTLYCSPK